MVNDTIDIIRSMSTFIEWFITSSSTIIEWPSLEMSMYINRSEKTTSNKQCTIQSTLQE